MLLGVVLDVEMDAADFDVAAVVGEVELVVCGLAAEAVVVAAGELEFVLGVVLAAGGAGVLVFEAVFVAGVDFAAVVAGLGRTVVATGLNAELVTTGLLMKLFKHSPP